MNPAEILTDFELAIIQAIQLKFPASNVNGCFFHFTRAINRKNIKAWTSDYISRGCPFLLLHTTDSSTSICTNSNVLLAWQEVKATAPNLPRVDEFITYFEETWLVGNFSLRLWNVYEIGSNSPRTNNHIEGWHNKYREKDNKIEILKERLRQDTITLEEYVRAISGHV